MKTASTLMSVAALCSYAAFASAQTTDIRQGLIAYWPLDSTDGLTTPDLSPYGNHLNLVNMDASNFVAGQRGNAAQFNGTDEILSRIYTPDPNLNGLPIYGRRYYTVMFWAKGVGATQGDRRLFSEGSTTDTDPLLNIGTDNAAAATRTNVVDIFIRNDAGGTAGTVINHRKSTGMAFDGNWHHVAWVEEDGIARLYIDGQLDATSFNYTPILPVTLNAISLGGIQRATTGSYFAGQMDEAALWERPLSQAEIQQVMNNGLETPVPELPPVIFAQPEGATRQLGDRYRFQARVAGNRPLSYQWFKGADAIPDANTATLSLSNLVVSDSGDYTVQVSNLDGTTTSSIATLNVLADPPANIRLGLISHWPLNDVGTDEFGNAYTPDTYSQNNMGLTNSLLFGDQIPGQFGEAITFNGSTQYGRRSGGFPIGVNSAYTVALWVNAGGIGQSDRRFFSESATNTETPLFGLGTHATGVDGTVRVYLRNDTNAVLVARNSTRPALDGTWHHVVWSDNNGQARLYIDGVLDESDFFYTRVGNFSFNQTTFAAIVRAAVGFHFTGALDDVAVWNRALTLTEVEEVRLNGIPPPLGAIPPEVTQQPASQSVLTRSRVTFSFAAIGTGPLTIQWRKGGENIPGEIGATLTFNEVTLGDAGSYDVVVANSAGRATSQVATLTVTLRPPPPADLRVDFADTANDIPANTEPGFTSFSIPTIGTGPFTKSFEGADVTLTAIGTTMETRKRAAPVNSGAFTQERLLQDFVFTRDADPNQGLDVAVEFLEPNTQYDGSVWSYDNTSVTLDRISDWSANSVPVRTGYTFFGSNLPVDNDTFRFTFTTTSDAAGKILIQGRRSASAGGTLNVFLNALTLTKRQIRVSGIQTVGVDLALTVQLLNPAAPHHVEEKTNLADAQWTTVANATFEPPVGNTQRILIPIPEGSTRFYRVVEGQ